MLWVGIIIGSLIALWLGDLFFNVFRLRRYFLRNPQTKAWKTTFPDVDVQQIEEFLRLFCEAFLIARFLRLRFRPEDKLIDIYRHLYPVNGVPDTMEFENLLMYIEGRYDRFLSPHDIPEQATLGDVFRLVRVEN